MTLPGTITTAARSEPSPAPGTTPTTNTDPAQLAEDQRILYIVTTVDTVDDVDLSNVAPYSRHLTDENGDVDFARFADSRLVRTPADLDDAGIGDHITYAVDWRSTADPAGIVARVMDVVRATEGGFTYDVV